ncbi:MAG: hypothetical protein WBL50_00300 [Candidatus Acidiferrum sp.]
MRPSLHNRRARGAESGYALVMVMFILALLVLTMAEAAPTVLSNIQREREKEMVWRGKQYTRGIRMYYTKMNRFPTSLDDLTKPKTGIRFMRQAYKDPMNQVDGSWRLIYVGPNGQLIGSLNNRTIGLGGMGGTPGVGGSPMAGSSSMSGGNGILSFGSNSANSTGFGMNQATATQQTGAVGTATTAATGTGATNTSLGTNGDPTIEDPTQPHSIAGPMDASNTIGGNIIGVGSKIDKKSFRIYEKAKNYKLFEFIWDPSKDTTVGRASAGIGTPVNSNGMSPAGTSPTGSPFSSGMNPGQNGTQTQNPSQNPAQNQNPNTNPDPNQIPPLQAPTPNQ